MTYQPTLEEMTVAINKSLESLKFTIRKTKRIIDGAILYGIVNTAADDISKAGSTFVPNQLIYFKHLVLLCSQLVPFFILKMSDYCLVQIRVLATEHKDDGRMKRDEATALHNSIEEEDKEGAKSKINLTTKQVDVPQNHFYQNLSSLSVNLALRSSFHNLSQRAGLKNPRRKIVISH